MQIQSRMGFRARPYPAEPSTVKQRQTNINSGGIERVSGLVEVQSKLVLSILGLGGFAG